MQSDADAAAPPVSPAPQAADAGPTDGVAPAPAAVDHASQSDDATEAEELLEESGDEDEDGRIAMDIEKAIEDLPEGQRRAKMREILALRRKGTKARVLKPRKPSESRRLHKQ